MARAHATCRREGGYMQTCNFVRDNLSEIQSVYDTTDRVCLSVCTCEGLVELLLAGGSLQQPPDGHNDTLKAGRLARILLPAILHRIRYAIKRPAVDVFTCHDKLWQQISPGQKNSSHKQHCRCQQNSSNMCTVASP